MTPLCAEGEFESGAELDGLGAEGSAAVMSSSVVTSSVVIRRVTIESAATAGVRNFGEAVVVMAGVVVLRKRALSFSQAAERLGRRAIRTGEGKRGAELGSRLTGASALEQNISEQKVSTKERSFLFGVAALDELASAGEARGRLRSAWSSKSAAS